MNKERKLLVDGDHLMKQLELSIPAGRFDEVETIAMITRYIAATYGQHYVGKANKMQILDVWDEMGIAEEMCLGTAIKYAMRFGKKEGRNMKDLQKLIHYSILAYHFATEKSARLYQVQQNQIGGGQPTTIPEPLIPFAAGH